MNIHGVVLRGQTRDFLSTTYYEVNPTQLSTGWGMVGAQLPSQSTRIEQGWSHGQTIDDPVEISPSPPLRWGIGRLSILVWARRRTASRAHHRNRYYLVTVPRWPASGSRRAGLLGGSIESISLGEIRGPAFHSLLL